MALNSNAFVEGIDPTGTFGGYASVLLQLIRQALPSSTYGMVLYDSATPDVAGANAWRQRCVWLDMTDTANPVAKVYRTTGSPGWVSVVSLIPNNTITTAMIQNAAVTLAKLSVAGGAANQLIRVNAGATAFEFVNFSSLFSAGVVPVNAINTTEVPPATFRALGSFGGAASTWFGADDIAGEFSAGSISALAIVPATTLSSASRFLTSRTSDTGAVWRLFDPVNDISDGGISGVKITSNSLAVAKLIAGTEGQILTVIGGTPVWSSSSPVTPTTFQENFVFATERNFAVPDSATTNKDYALTLPASRTWKDVDVRIQINRTDTNGGSTSCTASVKWNTAPRTDELVVVSATEGSGVTNDMVMDTTSSDVALSMSDSFVGIVPTNIASGNITIRVSFTVVGTLSEYTASVSIKARATANV
jgi:hypothetical protein